MSRTIPKPLFPFRYRRLGPNGHDDECVGDAYAEIDALRQVNGWNNSLAPAQREWKYVYLGPAAPATTP